DATPERLHQLELTRLDLFQTPFNVVVESCNPEALCVQGSVATQLQPRDNSPPAFQGPVQVAQRGQDAAFLAWRTDEPSTSEVHYQARTQRDTGWMRIESRKVTDHRITLTRLQRGTCYQATVSSVDPAGNRVTFPQTLDLCVGPVQSASRVALASAV